MQEHKQADLLHGLALGEGARAERCTRVGPKDLMGRIVGVGDGVLYKGTDRKPYSGNTACL